MVEPKAIICHQCYNERLWKYLRVMSLDDRNLVDWANEKKEVKLEDVNITS